MNATDPDHKEMEKLKEIKKEVLGETTKSIIKKKKKKVKVYFLLFFKITTSLGSKSIGLQKENRKIWPESTKNRRTYIYW